MSQPVFLSAAQIDSLISLDDVIELTEKAYRSVAEGTAVCPPKVSVPLPNAGGEDHWINSMPALLGEENVVGVKWSNVTGANKLRGLPRTMSTILLNDATTGAPLAVMDATNLTRMRSGAQLAVGAKYFARADASRVAVLGAGERGRTALAAYARVRKVKRVFVHSRTEASVRSFIRDMSAVIDAEFIPAATAEAAAKGADSILLATSARQTVLKAEWAKPGDYIGGLCAIADLDPAFLRQADKFLFDETKSAVKRVKDVIGVEIDPAGLHPDMCQVAAGRVSGRRSGSEIVVFTPIGLGAADVTIAFRAYRRAVEGGLGKPLEYEHALAAAAA